MAINKSNKSVHAVKMPGYIAGTHTLYSSWKWILFHPIYQHFEAGVNELIENNYECPYYFLLRISCSLNVNMVLTGLLTQQPHHRL